MNLVLVVVYERVLMSISHVITVECLRPHSPRLCFSDRVEIVPDEGESKRFYFSTRQYSPHLGRVHSILLCNESI